MEYNITENISLQFVTGKAGKVNIIVGGICIDTIYLDLYELHWVHEIIGFEPAKRIVVNKNEEIEIRNLTCPKCGETNPHMIHLTNPQTVKCSWCHEVIPI